MKEASQYCVDIAELQARAGEIIAEITGAERVSLQSEAATGSEDFADMLKAAPGVYFTVGHKGDVPLHNPGFVFDDDVIPLGASMLVSVAAARLAAG